jgi:hypothetical protein
MTVCPLKKKVLWNYFILMQYIIVSFNAPVNTSFCYSWLFDDEELEAISDDYSWLFGDESLDETSRD